MVAKKALADDSEVGLINYKADLSTRRRSCCIVRRILCRLDCGRSRDGQTVPSLVSLIWDQSKGKVRGSTVLTKHGNKRRLGIDMECEEGVAPGHHY